MDFLRTSNNLLRTKKILIIKKGRNMVINGIGLQVRLPSKATEIKYQVNYGLFLVYEGKASQAEQANQKVLAKYESLYKYVQVCGGSEKDVMAIMPKVQVSQFI